MLDNIDILEVSGSFGCSAGLISLDQGKAFDRVQHHYLWKVLERFGLNHEFIAKIMVLYEDIESVLKMNGRLSEPFKRCLTRLFFGVLYSFEPMLNKIK